MSSSHAPNRVGARPAPPDTAAGAQPASPDAGAAGEPPPSPDTAAAGARPGDRAAAYQLALLAGSILYLELAIIRFAAAHVLYLGYFSNFILLSVFVGLGLGFLAARRSSLELRALLPFVLLFLFALVLVSQFDVDLLRNRGGLFHFGNLLGRAGLPAAVLLPILFLTTVVLFAALAQQTGRLFDRFPPLRAYALDVGGSLLGIVLFSAQSYVWSGPEVWVLTGCGLLTVAELLEPRAPLGARLRRAGAVAAAALTVVVLLLSASGRRDMTVIWSTYQKLAYEPPEGEAASKRAIYANGVLHQFAQQASKAGRGFYQVPYELQRQRGGVLGRVLIIGAGSGTDVALALANGAGRVVAVEIDEGIAEIGRRHHPDRPYHDPRVDLQITDGRQYLRSSHEQFDLILFALPDSLVLLSSMSSLRLESYLFTLQAFADARARLSPGGALYLYNQYRWPWLELKVARMLEQVFGQPPVVARRGATTILGAGARLRGDPLPAPGERLEPATDDWPFLYMKRPGFSWPYLGMIGMLLLGALLGVALLAPRGTLRRPALPYFFMGAAFLLLETRSLSLFSLLFGTTWLVNSLAFGGVLVSVLLANLLVARLRLRRRLPLFLGLFVALAAGYLVPTATLLAVASPALRYLVALALVFSPIFLANLVFSRELRDAEVATRALGWNLLGAVVGGGLEYASLLIGTRALLWIAAGCYLLTALTIRSVSSVGASRTSGLAA